MNDDPNETERLREHALYLERKIKYMQSVGTVFRQKIALIMREWSKNPAAFGEYEKQFAAALGELMRAEANEPTREEHELPGSVATLVSSSDRQRQAQRSSKEDILKAHHLCSVLQEKNELKQKLVTFRAAKEELQKKFDDLSERHTRLVELQATGSGASAAQQELAEQREAALQKQLIEAKTEIARLQTASNPAVVYEDAAVSDTTLQKQNSLLKGRVSKLKEEIAHLQSASEQASSEVQHDLDALVEKCNALRMELASSDEAMQFALREKGELAKEVVAQRSREELLRAKVASLEAEVAAWQKNEVEQKASSTENLASASYGRAMDRLEAQIVSLRRELQKSEELRMEKDTEIQALGAEISAFRRRIEAFEAESEQRGVQHQLVAGVEERLFSAVRDIQQSQSTALLTAQMNAIHTKLQQLEGVELQLRQKEDELAVAEDAAREAKKAQKLLQDSLESISKLFLLFPKSVAQYERMAVELEEYRREVKRCVTERDIPDLVKLEGTIDLRCLEAETQRSVSRPKDSGSPGAAQVAQDGSSSDSEEDAAGSANELYEAALSQIPQPPPLIDIQAAAMVPPTAQPQVADTDRLSESEIRLTFQLFDEQNRGILPVEMIKLCLTTLGLSTKILPEKCTSMGIHEFVALCLHP